MGAVAATLSLPVTIILIGALRPFAGPMGFLDRPGGRKAHDGDVPLLGGIAMFGGIFSGLAFVPGGDYALLPLFVASSILVGIGAIDDRFPIGPLWRFGAQIIAVLLMIYAADLPLTGIGDPFGTGEIRMGRFTLVFTLLVSLTMINAYNLIDGVDGLAGSLAVVALLAIAIASGPGHDAAAYASTCAAAIVGFLLFNFPSPWNHRVRTFMGDAGSTLLGFTIVWITLGMSQEPGRIASPVICLWFASIPIYDTLTCFVRRALQRRSPFSPGRDHFHHMLLDNGFGVGGTLAVLVGLQAAYAAAALIAFAANVPDVVMFSAWSVLFVTQRAVISLIAELRRTQVLREEYATGD